MPSGPVDRRLSSTATFGLTDCLPRWNTTIFRIVQEGLNNAIRHSKSERVRIELAQRGNTVHIEVGDSGVGFNPDQIGTGHFGIQGMRDRAGCSAVRLSSALPPGTELASSWICRSWRNWTRRGNCPSRGPNRSQRVGGSVARCRLTSHFIFQRPSRFKRANAKFHPNRRLGPGIGPSRRRL